MPPLGSGARARTEARRAALCEITLLMRAHSISPRDIIEALLANNPPQPPEMLQGFLDDAPQVLTTFYRDEHLHAIVSSFSQRLMKEQYTSQLLELVKPSAGFHFPASKVTPKQILEFSGKEVQRRMSTIAPSLWELLVLLLSADAVKNRRRVTRQGGEDDGSDSNDEGGSEEDDDNEHGSNEDCNGSDIVQEPALMVQLSGGPNLTKRQKRAIERFDACCKMVSASRAISI